MYVAFEGIDGSGKSTIIKILKKEFPNYTYVREPGSTPFAESLRDFMFKEHADVCSNISGLTFQSLMHTARIDLTESLAKNSLLSDNEAIISDRCFLSSVYCKTDFEKIWNMIDNDVRTLCKLPNAIIYLSLTPQVSIDRLKNRKDSNFMDSDSLNNIQRILTNYEMAITKAQIQLKVKFPFIKVIDATRPLKEVYSEVKTFIDTMMKV